METADDYTLEKHFKALASRLRVRAIREKAGVLGDELQHLAACYARLAEEESARNYL